MMGRLESTQKSCDANAGCWRGPGGRYGAGLKSKASVFYSGLLLIANVRKVSKIVLSWTKSQ